MLQDGSNKSVVSWQLGRSCDAMTGSIVDWDVGITQSTAAPRSCHGSTQSICAFLESGKSYQWQHSARAICITLMFVACVKWQFVNFKDFSRYPFLLPQLASDALQNVPFCSGERGLQGHALLDAVTPSPRQLCLASSHLLPSLLLIQKVCFVRENCIFLVLVPGRTSTRFTVHLSAFRDSSLPCCMKQEKNTFVPGTNFLYRTKHRLVHF